MTCFFYYNFFLTEAIKLVLFYILSTYISIILHFRTFFKFLIDFQVFLQHQKPYMALEQLKKISQKGFGISNHGFDHPLYKDLTLHQQVENTDQARHYIKQNNFIHESFAFPFTDFGVKQEFFDEVFKNQNLFCSFGCAGIKFDSFSKNFQRIPMENGKVAAQTLKEETAYYQSFLEGELVEICRKVRNKKGLVIKKD